MLGGVSSLLSATLRHAAGAVKLLSARTIEFFILWRYVQQIEGQRERRRHEREAANKTHGAVSQPSPPPDDMEDCHRQAIAGLTLLGQRVPNLMGGYYRPTLQSIYGEPFVLSNAMKQRREVVAENVFLYRLKARSSVKKVPASPPHVKRGAPPCTTTAHQGQTSVEDVPLFVWFMLPWEDQSPVILRFVLRLSQSLGCDTLFVTVPIHGASGPRWVATTLLSMVETGRRKTQAQRVLIGGSDLSGMLALLYLERHCRLLQTGALAAADPEVARCAFCQGVLLVDPFVGWEMPGPLRDDARAGTSSGEDGTATGGSNSARQGATSSPSSSSSSSSSSSPSSSSLSPSLSAKERFKQVVMDSSSGCIQEWFPLPITYEAPPIVVLVDEGGFWLQEQCAFNARIDRFRNDGSEERVFFLPYVVETAAVGTLTSANCRMELERLWRMVEKFLSNQLAPVEPYAGLTHVATPSAEAPFVGRSNARFGSRRREAEVTFMAALAP